MREETLLPDEERNKQAGTLICRFEMLVVQGRIQVSFVDQEVNYFATEKPNTRVTTYHEYSIGQCMHTSGNKCSLTRSLFH